MFIPIEMLILITVCGVFCVFIAYKIGRKTKQREVDERIDLIRMSYAVSNGEEYSFENWIGWK